MFAQTFSARRRFAAPTTSKGGPRRPAPRHEPHCPSPRDLPWWRSPLAAIVGCALAIALTGCGPSSEDETSSTTSDAVSPSQQESSEKGAAQEAPAPATITITDFEFEGPATVAPGAEVEVVNDDRSSHSVTSEDDVFTEVIVEGGGATGTFTAPSEPGKYAYVCKFHPEMVAMLVVK